jgi:hypothetical protein
MRRKEAKTWWGLYALVPIAGALLYIVARVHTGETLHLILVAAVAVGAAIFALRWTEGHADLMGSQGVDARAEEDALADAGIEPGRFAPSVNLQQAHYRQVMLAHKADEAPPRS